ncbi:MAG: DMT family transporter [Bacillati bacterium ANGP1]|uniref:DMT family transporter n=1 Tax=Candidatus Segetimicrobium genomatis TaxID=2569760 RepID=A0A537KZN7_9BACT|nr:MAG: DMT family transporter [Terrabacteria group bacterium ANGP1]
MTERAQTKIPAIDPFRITNHKSRITSRRVEFAMLALVVIWGVNFPIVKIAFREMTPMVFNALRFGSATVLLLAVSWRTREPLPPRAAWPGLVGLGIIGHAIYQISFINGLALTTAGNSALILSMVPLFIAALTSLLRIDRVAPRTWIGIVFAFVGLLLLITGRGGLHLGMATLAGDILTLFCSLCWAMYTVFSRPLLKTMSPLQLTTLTMAAGAPALLVASIPQLLQQPWAAISWQAWAALAYSTVLAVAVGYVVWYASVQAVGGPRTAIYSNLIPIVALLASWLLLGESLGPVQAAGAAVVLAGVSLARS